jgi:hypothetical protein
MVSYTTCTQYTLAHYKQSDQVVELSSLVKSRTNRWAQHHLPPLHVATVQLFANRLLLLLL